MNLFKQFVDFWLMPLRALLRVPAAAFSAPQKIMGMSLPGRAAVLVAIGLIICTLAVFISKWLDPNRRDFWLEFPPGVCVGCLAADRGHSARCLLGIDADFSGQRVAVRGYRSGLG